MPVNNLTDGGGASVSVIGGKVSQKKRNCKIPTAQAAAITPDKAPLDDEGQKAMKAAMKIAINKMSSSEPSPNVLISRPMQP